MAWKYYGQRRPPFADPVGPGQESVWDYPRPPLVEPVARRVSVLLGGLKLADTQRALAVLETASAPGVYIPREDIRMSRLRSTSARRLCGWKGEAEYFDVLGAHDVISRAAWSYANPLPGFDQIAGHISFYPGKVECYVEAERVRPQPGGFYGGWVTSDIAGPVKGGSGTAGW